MQPMRLRVLLVFKASRDEFHTSVRLGQRSNGITSSTGEKRGVRFELKTKTPARFEAILCQPLCVAVCDGSEVYRSGGSRWRGIDGLCFSHFRSRDASLKSFR
jgi:hypothetical protein